MRFVAALLLLLASGAAHAQGIDGTWVGSLDTPVGSLTFVLHVTPEADGYTVTADSPDQGATGIEGAVEASGDAWVFTFPSVRATYTATVEDDALTGTFQQGGAELPLTLSKTGGVRPPAPAAGLGALVGDWNGVLMDALPVVFHLSPGTHPDTLRATLDSPSQDAFGIPTAGAWMEGERLVLEVPAVNGRLEADVRGDTLSGTWTQGQPLPLVLVRASGDVGQAPEAPNRPQTPAGSFPYTEESLRVESAPGVTLAGTLTIPEGDGPFTAVVLVSGSGPQDRDETILGHKAFAVWADRLSRAGVAVYRFDDRGTAESTGDWASATIEDFSTDTAASVRALLARDDIDRVGIMGHSEGGYVAPHVAQMLPETAFVVLLAGPGVVGSEVYVEQQRLISSAQGIPMELATLYSETVRGLISPYTTLDPDQTDEQRRVAGERAARAVLDAAPEATRSALLGGESPDATFARLLDFVSTPGIGSFLAFDPREDLEALSIPALAIFGGLDLQVPPAQSARPLAEALAESDSPSYAVVTFDGLNHLFQPTETGRIEEYGRIETTVSEEVLSLVTRWVVAL